ncbi:hypothetical protein OC845_001941 [Tilletia horrida]|nr:hypothetical protein OC845_001941 [Tilletia horrida]
MAASDPPTASLGSAALHPALRPFARPSSSNSSIPQLQLPQDQKSDFEDEDEDDFDYEFLDQAPEAEAVADPWNIEDPHQMPVASSSSSAVAPRPPASKHEQYPPPSALTANSTPAPPQAPDQPLHDALSSELLRLSTVLRSNAVAFGAALERDRLLLEKSSDHLGANLDFMTRTRGRLGEYSRKARGMGWFTLTAIGIVMISWMLCFVVIRIT